jgi:DNA-binding transcriptional ArsR family regulator
MKKRWEFPMDDKMKFICCDISPEKLENLDNKDIDDFKAVEILKKIAHPLRLKILRILCKYPDFCTCDLEKFFSESQPVISRHLSILANAEILECKTLPISGFGGRWHAYRINSKIKSLISHLILPFSHDGEILMKVISENEKN